MPSPPAPKKWKAARAFTYRHQHYAVGDPVEDRRTIDKLVRYGDRFIIPKRKPANAEHTHPESVKED